MIFKNRRRRLIFKDRRRRLIFAIFDTFSTPANFCYLNLNRYSAHLNRDPLFLYLKLNRLGSKSTVLIFNSPATDTTGTMRRRRSARRRRRNFLSAAGFKIFLSCTAVNARCVSGGVGGDGTRGLGYVRPAHANSLPTLVELSGPKYLCVLFMCAMPINEAPVRRAPTFRYLSLTHAHPGPAAGPTKFPRLARELFSSMLVFSKIASLD